MKLQIAGRAIILTSSIPVATIEQLKKFKPAALQVSDEKGKPIFGIDYAKGKPGNLGLFGVTFNDKDSDGKARVTLSIPDSVCSDKRKESVEAQYAMALLALKNAESVILANYTELKASFDTLTADITSD